MGCVIAAMMAWSMVAEWPVRAQDTAVPIGLQVELLARLLWYERGLQKRSADTLAVMIVERPRDAESERAAAQLSAQLERVKQLGGKTIQQARVVYESAEQVRVLVEQQHVYLVYLSAGLGEATPELTRALSSQEVLTVSADGDDAERGVVLGFVLESAKPRIILDLKQARAHKLDFSAQVLRIVRVVP